MSRPEGLRRPPASPLRRAHRSLWVLIAVSILASGGLSAAVSAPPTPTTGMWFAFSAVVLVVAGFLAARVVVALERARRAARPPAPPLATGFPVVSRLVGIRRVTSVAGHRGTGADSNAP